MLCLAAIKKKASRESVKMGKLCFALILAFRHSFYMQAEPGKHRHCHKFNCVKLPEQQSHSKYFIKLMLIKINLSLHAFHFSSHLSLVVIKHAETAIKMS